MAVGNTYQVPDLRTWTWFQSMSSKFGESIAKGGSSFLFHSGPIAWFNIKGDNILLLSDPHDAEALVCVHLVPR